MTRNVTYAHLDAVLRKLGFEKRQLKSGHIGYAHRESETLITMPPMEADARVQPGHLITARKMIVDRGIADEDTFFDLLCEVKQAPKTSEGEIVSLV
jgi:hypothetical protein